MVYSIPCDCGAMYIGETGRNLKVRITKHKWAITFGDNRNAIAMHIMEFTDHKILWNDSNMNRIGIEDA